MHGSLQNLKTNKQTKKSFKIKLFLFCFFFCLFHPGRNNTPKYRFWCIIRCLSYRNVQQIFRILENLNTKTNCLNVSGGRFMIKWLWKSNVKTCKYPLVLDWCELYHLTVNTRTPGSVWTICCGHTDLLVSERRTSHKNFLKMKMPLKGKKLNTDKWGLFGTENHAKKLCYSSRIKILSLTRA